MAGDNSSFWSERPCLAVSTDDKYVYFAGLGAGAGDYKKVVPLPCVFRVDVAKRGPAEVFVGKLGEPGKEKANLTAPRGVAVANGLLYVADPPADRVVVFKEADRSYAGEIAVKDPQVIGVDPASGAVYVCAYNGTQTADLIKFSGLGKARSSTGSSCRVPAKAPTRAFTASPWIPPPSRCASGCRRSTRFRPACSASRTPAKNLSSKGDPRGKSLWAEGPRDLTVDRLRGEVYVKASDSTIYRLDDSSGQSKAVIDVTRLARGTVLAAQLIPGPDGYLYAFTWNKGLWRFDHDAKPKNWDGLDTFSIPLDGMMCFQLRHLALRPYAPTDEIYVIATVDSVTKNPKDAGKFLTLNAVGQDGKTKRTVIWQCLNGAIPRVDAKGNIYLADLVKPPDRSYPEFFDGKLPAPPKECTGGDLFWYSYMYGSIIKFPPSGGIIWHQKTLPKSGLGSPPAELLEKPKIPFKRHFSSQPHLTGTIQGALWTRFGYAPYSAHMSGNTSHCMCEGSGFDVDPFGRVFFPNAGQFRIEVVDTNNNPITTFGKYGNEDSGGPGARVKKPEIPLAWPSYVAVSDRYAYVADTVNRRVVRVKLGHAAEGTCAVP